MAEKIRIVRALIAAHRGRWQYYSWKNQIYGSGMYDIWPVKADSSREMIWDKTFRGTLDDEQAA